MIKVNLATVYFVLACLLSVARGEEAEVKQVASDGVRLPWHTTDLYWKGASSVPDVKTIGVTFTVDRDVPDSVNLYIAPMGGQYLNSIMFAGCVARLHLSGQQNFKKLHYGTPTACRPTASMTERSKF